MRPSGRGGAVVAVAPRPAAWRRHEDALAERILALHGAASHTLQGEQNVGVISHVLAGDLTGAVAALTVWSRTTLLRPPRQSGVQTLPRSCSRSSKSYVRSVLK